jgi:hypothetical protein
VNLRGRYIYRLFSQGELKKHPALFIPRSGRIPGSQFT